MEISVAGSISSVSSSATWPSLIRSHRCAADVPSRGTVTMRVKRPALNVRRVENRTSRLAVSVGCSIRPLMPRSMKFLQLNVQKQRSGQHSMMNDASLQGFTALVVSEPCVFEMDGKVMMSPLGHQGWTAILPSERHDGRWVVRSPCFGCVEISNASR